MKNLGVLNGFTTTPDELLKCIELGHTRESTNIGKCLNKFSCVECEITYTVDSSD